MIRLLAGLLSLVVVVLLVVMGGIAYLFGTDHGKSVLRGQIERVAATALGPDLRVELGGQRFAMPVPGTFGAGFSDIRILDRADDRVLATLSNASVGLRLTALLSGRIDLDTITATGARLDPALAERFGSGPPDPDRYLAGLDTGFAAISRMRLASIDVADVAALGGQGANRLDRLRLDAADDGTFSLSGAATLGTRHLAAEGAVRLNAEGTRVVGFDLTLPTLDAADRFAVLTPSADLDRVRPLRSRLTLTGAEEGAREVLLNTAIPFDTQAPVGSFLSGEATFSYAEGSGVIRLAPATFDFGNARASLRGDFALRPDENGDRALTLRSDRLVSSVGQPEGREVVAELDIGGTLHGDGALDLSKLLLTVGQSSIRGSVRWNGGTGADGRVSATLVAANVSAASGKAFWPFFIAEDTRDWVLKHVGDAGRAGTAAFSFNATAARLAELTVPGHGPTQDELRLDVSLEDADFTTVGTLPRITSAAARIAVRGPQTSIDFDAANVEGFETIDVKPSRIAFERAGEGKVQSNLTLNLSGNLPDMLQVADREPIRALQRIGWKSEEVAGKAEMTIGVSLLLGRGQRGAEVLQGWSVLGMLDGADLKRPVNGRILTGLTGTVSIAPGTAIGTLDGAIDGIRSKIEFTRPIEPDPMGKASLSVEARVSEKEIADRLPALSRLLDGPVTVKLAQVESGFDVDADLSEARLAMPGLEWSKGRGVAARLTMKAALQKTGASLSDIRLKGDGFSATGRAEVDARGLRLVELDQASFNSGDDFRLSVNRTENGFTIGLKGDQLDARPIIARLKTGPGGGGKGGDTLGDIALTVDIRRLVGFGQEVLKGVSLAYETRGGAPAAVDVTAETDKGASFKGALSGGASNQKITFSAQDAGSLLRFSGYYPRMSGGQARVELGGSRNGGYSGAARIDNFTLVDEPRLARIVGTTGAERKDTLASALGRDLEVANAYFDTASLSVSYRAGTLQASEGIVRGPVFGSSFSGLLASPKGEIDVSGSFMPAYGVNRLFGAIPFVGGILGNGAEGGLIGITYRLSGAVDDPTLAVNPISAIAPGIFRRIFQF